MSNHKPTEFLIEVLDPDQVESGSIDPDIIDVHHFERRADAVAFLDGLSAITYVRIGLDRDDADGTRSWAYVNGGGRALDLHFRDADGGVTHKVAPSWLLHFSIMIEAGWPRHIRVVDGNVPSHEWLDAVTAPMPREARDA